MNLFVLFVRLKKIPTEIVEMLNEADQTNVDTDVLPRFDYEKCPGKMIPNYYIGVKSKIYKYEEK